MCYSLISTIIKNHVYIWKQLYKEFIWNNQGKYGALRNTEKSSHIKMRLQEKNESLHVSKQFQHKRTNENKQTKKSGRFEENKPGIMKVEDGM